MNEKNTISVATMKRLPLYLSYLQSLSPDAPVNISATSIAAALKLNEVQVRKDLAHVSSGGRPKIGYKTVELIADLEACIGSEVLHEAVLVGTGNLGKALLNYNDFGRYGVHIAVAFDQSPENVGSCVNGKQILPCEQLSKVCAQRGIRLGIISVPQGAAQAVCDEMVKSGITAIWNFAHVKLIVPPGVVVLDEHIGTSLPWLVGHLSQ